MTEQFPSVEELQLFFLENGIDEKAQTILMAASPIVQKDVLARGSLAESTNASSAMMSRIRDAQKKVGRGELKSGIVYDADEFILNNGLDEKAAEALKSCSYEIQQIVMDRGGLAETRNPSSALNGRIRDATTAIKGGGKGGGNGNMSSQQNPLMQMMQMMMSGAADLNPSKKKKQKVSEVSGASGYTGDAWTDGQLDKWIAAKRSKDFATADAIRDELRALGVDPNAVRPKGWDGSGSGGAKDGYTGDAWTDGQLDKWVAAKRSKDFAAADAIRDELRALGVDPNALRPKGWDGSGTGGGNDNPMMQMMQMMMGMSGSGGSNPSKHKNQNNRGDGQSQLDKAKAEQKVWVGGLTKNETWKELQKHFDAVAKTKWVEKLSPDTACIVFGNAEDATTAITTLSGSTLGEAILVCSVWE